MARYKKRAKFAERMAKRIKGYTVLTRNNSQTFESTGKAKKYWRQQAALELNKAADLIDNRGKKRKVYK